MCKVNISKMAIKSNSVINGEEVGKLETLILQIIPTAKMKKLAQIKIKKKKFPTLVKFPQFCSPRFPVMKTTNSRKFQSGKMNTISRTQQSQKTI